MSDAAGQHWVVTDSGLGGMSVLAALQSRLDTTEVARLTYFNAWPAKGYNELPTVAVRAAVFDRALSRMARLAPDRILIACNTLSILYPHTAFGRATSIPIHGIVEAGVGLFAESLATHPSSLLALLGTKTTIESGAHRDALLRQGIPPGRLLAIPCHGLARAIEQDPEGPDVTAYLREAADALRAAAPKGSPVLVGLACTHYAYVQERLQAIFEETLSRPTLILDPNQRMAAELVPTVPDPSGPSVQVLSKVELQDTPRRSIARLIEPISAASARALLDYRHIPDLF